MSATVGPAILCALDSPWESVTMADVTGKSSGEEHPNAIAYRRAAAAFRSRDLLTIADLVDPDVVWHVPGQHPLAGDYRGRTNCSASSPDCRSRLRTGRGGRVRERPARLRP